MRKIAVLFLFFLQPFFTLHSWSAEQKIAVEQILAEFEIYDSVVDRAKKLWVQQGKERWEYDERFEEKRDTLWPLFEKAGFVQTALPQKSEYDYLLIHGALLTRIELRWRFACALWESGLRFRTIVFLSGYRPLQPCEKEQIADSSLKSEAELTKWIYARSSLPIGMESVPVIFIDAPPLLEARATTKDTVKAWLQTNPIPGSCLAISNQPYVAYQDAVLLNYLPASFSLETVGPGIEDAPSVALLLDTLGRTLGQSR